MKDSKFEMAPLEDYQLDEAKEFNSLRRVYHATWLIEAYHNAAEYTGLDPMNKDSVY
jgi:hypothetical protein